MQSFAQYALPATILASALGAIVLCLVLFLYGFPRDAPDESPPRERRLFVIRLGHAIAAACFAAAAILGGVAWFDQQSGDAPAPRAAAQLREAAAGLEAQVETLEDRLAVAESRLDEARRDLALVESRVGSARATPMPSAAPRGRPEVQPVRRDTRAREVAARDAVTASAPLDPSPPTPSDDLGARLRSDWQLVKRGFRNAGSDLREQLSDLGRQVRAKFGSD